MRLAAECMMYVKVGVGHSDILAQVKQCRMFDRGVGTWRFPGASGFSFS